MNLLVIGSGGREHALAWKLAQSSQVNRVFVAPGNAGTATEPKLENIDIKPMAFEQLAEFALSNEVAFTLVGPEAPLVDGIVDYFESKNLRCFGPSKAASQLEGSKTFSKDFLARNQIPTANYQSFEDLNEALDYLRTQTLPIVVKADGLAAGKGVLICHELQEAEQAVSDMLSGNQFGAAGHRVVIEDFLEGEEASFIVLCDGTHVLPMASSQDHKRIGDGDQGLNTGGMGAYSPAPVVTQDVHQRIMDTIIYPTVSAMRNEGNEYRGFLYAGLMIDAGGQPKVIEFNCRFGDPETQPIMMRLQSDLVDLCQATLTQRLDTQTAQWDTRAAVGVVLAEQGYPGSYQTGSMLNSEACTISSPAAKIFQAGTGFKQEQLVSNGGRVLCATALGADIKAAQQSAYELVEQVAWDSAYWRKDIAYRAIS